MWNLKARILWLTISAVIITLSFFVYPRKSLNELPPSQVPVFGNQIQAIPYYSTATSSAYAVKGYYSQHQKMIEYDPGNPQTFLCDTFIVASGSNPITENLISYIKEGNTVNSLTPEGKLRLNIDLKAIDKVTKDAVLSSNESKIITLSMSEKRLQGKGAQPCESFVEIEGFE